MSSAFIRKISVAVTALVLAVCVAALSRSVRTTRARHPVLLAAGRFQGRSPIHHDHCNQTIFVGEDGRGTQVPPGTTINYTVRDLYDRPWARIWEQYFEKGMKRPAAAEDLGGFQ